MERDLSRLHDAMSNEGLSFLTITHPDMCNFFQKSLASQTCASAVVGQPPRGFGRKSGSDARPAYLHGLLDLVFDIDGTLRDDPDSTAVFFLRQWLLMAKKVTMECSDDRLETALTEFTAIDAELPDHWPDTWDVNNPKWIARTGHPLWGPVLVDQDPDLFEIFDRADAGIDWKLFRSLCGVVRSALGTCDPFALRPKHGPGAVADGDGLKYEFRHWPEKLQSIFPWDFFASSDFGQYKTDYERLPDNREFPSVVLAVPKTQKAPRIICKEPIAHQWIQGGIERWLVARLNHTILRGRIEFQDQSASQRLALEASCDGSLATVDLSAASDRISTRLVEFVFQGGDNSLLDAFHACRSRYYMIGDDTYKFRKFSPMGSACTFPVQSIIFALISTFAIMQSRGLGLKDAAACAEQVRVFGDDIIIPTDTYPVLLRVLTTLGLKVNVNKSYFTGLFRESCGYDAFSGVDVTPAYVRQAYNSSNHTSLQSVVECSNNFFKKGLWHTSAALLKTVPMAERKLLTIGYDGGGAVSLFSYMGECTDHLQSRWSGTLHRREYRALTMSSKTSHSRSDGDAGLIQFFCEEPDPGSRYESGQVLRSRATKGTRWI
jgi:hypothetical protein